VASGYSNRKKWKKVVLKFFYPKSFGYISSMEKLPKYLIRWNEVEGEPPLVSGVFELDPYNNCYRTYEEPGKEIENRSHAQDHFTYENLVEGYGFSPIENNQLETAVEAWKFYVGFISWRSRNDGHGEPKGGTLLEYRQYLKDVADWKRKKEYEQIDRIIGEKIQYPASIRIKLSKNERS